MSRRDPSNAEPIQFCEMPRDLAHALPQAEAGGIGASDPVFEDLTIRNLARAVVDGGLGARWELGAAIGAALCGGKR